MEQKTPVEIELLAPARDYDTAIAAIDHGADAVYMGASSFGARCQAGNTVSDIARVAAYAHKFGAKLYVTVNTIIYDRELADVCSLIWALWRAGADALIVQDLAVTGMTLPPIALHASTQCDTRNPEKARFLESLGFTRIVLAREQTAREIAEIRQNIKTDIEVFAHGALCVSYSGDCQASYALTGRSANRGECCQVCRFKFDLEDSKGNKIIRGKHLLSLRDMNRLENIELLLEAGATSLKIEGRLKDAAYVKNVVAAYRRKLDSIIGANPEKYRRASYGATKTTFTPDLSAVFNRGFTDYFLTSPQPDAGSLATFGSPKWIGRPVGNVIKKSGNTIIARLTDKLSNGDGLGYFTVGGEFRGFRLNRVDGDRLYPATPPADIPPGTVLYRNSDKVFDRSLEGMTATRRIAVVVALEWRNGNLTLTLTDESGAQVTVAEEFIAEQARSPQIDRRRKELEKMGDTIYIAQEIHDNCGDCFIAASTLSRLRRRATEMLDAVHAATYRAERPGKPSAHIEFPEGYRPTRHDNIANSTAASLFSKLTGTEACNLPRAIETASSIRAEEPAGGIRVMQTRYCLRRELGKCTKSQHGNSLPAKLYLTSEGKRFRLDFDCRNCRMNVIYLPEERTRTGMRNNRTSGSSPK